MLFCWQRGDGQKASKMEQAAHKRTAAQRRPEVYRLWMVGSRMADIAAMYGVTIRQIYRDLATHRRKLLREDVDVQAHVLRQLEDMQMLREKTLAIVDTPDGRAELLRLMEREARLLGLDAPAKQALRIGGRPGEPRPGCGEASPARGLCRSSHAGAG